MHYSFTDFKSMAEQHLMSVIPRETKEHYTFKILPAGNKYTLCMTDTITQSQYNIALLPYYQKYRAGNKISFVLYELSNKVMELTGNYIDCSFLSQILKDWNTAQNYVTMTLVSERNFKKYRLENTHPQVIISNTGMQVLFLISLHKEISAGKYLTTTITNQMMQKWNIDTTVLLNKAKENAPTAVPVELRWLEDTLDNVITVSESESLQAISKTMVVVHAKNNAPDGAVTILYEGVQQKIAEMLGTNEFYVIPSNIHEMLCLPKSFAPLTDVLENTKFINANIVDDNDFLADDIFEFDKEGRLVSATAAQSDPNFNKAPTIAYAYAYE